MSDERPVISPAPPFLRARHFRWALIAFVVYQVLNVLADYAEHDADEPDEFAIEVAEAIFGGGAIAALAALVAAWIDLNRQRRESERQRLIDEQYLLLGRLAGGIAHEIRNPVMNMVLVLEELHAVLGDLGVVAEVEGMLGSADGNLKRIDHAIDLIYRLARPADLERRLGRFEHFAVELLINDALATLDDEGRRRIDRSLPEDDCRIACDRDATVTIISNLLRNALDANAGSRVCMSATKVGNVTMLAVSNEGRLPDGFAIPDLRHPFATGTSGSGHGLGLGLIIAAELARQMRMTLAVANIDERVSFSLNVPAVLEGT